MDFRKSDLKTEPKKLEKIREIHIESTYFDLEKTLYCGQAFRWRKAGDVFYAPIDHSVVVARKTAVTSTIQTNKTESYIFEIYGDDFTKEQLITYFDLERDYASILEEISGIDEHLKAAVLYGKGIRIMRQGLVEMLITFILSSNNNIPKISMTVEALCEKFGDALGVYNGEVLYSFPTIAQLSDASLEDLNVKAIGYRAKSLYATIQLLLNSQLDLNEPFRLSHHTSVEWLKQFHGVGNKVANCILLFAYGDYEAFPVDTWVKRMLNELYGVEKKHEAFVESYFTKFPGIAQQYLFYYIRKG